MRFDFFQDSARDFWTSVDSMESLTTVYACTCPSLPDHLGDCGTRGPGWQATRTDVGCMAMRSDRTKCREAAVEDAPLCDKHMEKAAHWFVTAHPEVFVNWLGHAERNYAENIIRAEQVADLEAEIGALKSRVYFIGIGDQIVKIGRSVRPENRLTQIRQGSGLMPAGYDRKRAEILGTIPGGARTEQRLHQLLRPHRLAGEWFGQHRDVIAVMASFLAGEMVGDANRVFTDSLTRPWWVDEGYITESDAIADMEATA